MSARKKGDRPGQRGGSTDKNPENAKVFGELAKATDDVDPVPDKVISDAQRIGKTLPVRVRDEP